MSTHSRRVHSFLVHELERYPQHTKVRFLTFSRDGTKLAAAGDAPSIFIFDVNARRKVFCHTLADSEHSLAIVWLAKATGEFLAHLSSNGFLRIFNPEKKGSPPLEIEAHTPVAAARSKGCLTAATDGSLLATAIGPEFKVWDIRTRGMPIARLSYENSSVDASYISHLCFLPGSEQLLSFFVNERIVVKTTINVSPTTGTIQTNMRNVSASVSSSGRQFVVHDSFQGARIFSLDGSGSDESPHADVVIPYTGSRVAIPILHAQADVILIGDSGMVKVYDADDAGELGKLGINCVRILGMASGKVTPPLCVAISAVYDGYESLEIWNVVFINDQQTGVDLHPPKRIRLAPSTCVTPSKRIRVEENLELQRDDCLSASYLRLIPCLSCSEAAAIMGVEHRSKREQQPQSRKGKANAEGVGQSKLAAKGPAQTYSAIEECRFRGFRNIADSTERHNSFYSSLVDMPSLHFVEWNPPRTMDHVLELKRAAAEFLLPEFKNELKHVAREDILYKTLKLDARDICDICNMGLFLCVWFCRDCGMEICGPCHSDMISNTNIDSQNQDVRLCGQRTHSQDAFIPVTFFSFDQLTADIAEMEALGDISPLQIDRSSLLVNEDNRMSHLGFRWPAAFDAADLDDKCITELWDNCQPFVVKNAMSLMTPQAFLLGVEGEPTCTISFLNGDEWVDTRSTLQEYFQSWATGSDRALQVRDYPPDGHLHDFHPTLSNSFQTALQLMMPSHTMRSGGLNLASCYPKGSAAPDLGKVIPGPKLYIAMADPDRATTKLHIDKSGAVNIMFHSEATEDENGAEWYIWPYESIAAISEVVRPEDPNSGGISDAILSEMYYLDADTRRKIFLKCGYPPWRIFQKPGDAVFIPPRHPHQVSNRAHSMKIACDFVSFSHLTILQQTGKDLQESNRRDKVHTDLLHLTRMAWFAWCSCRG